MQLRHILATFIAVILLGVGVFAFFTTTSVLDEVVGENIYSTNYNQSITNPAIDQYVTVPTDLGQDQIGPILFFNGAVWLTVGNEFISYDPDTGIITILSGGL